ncbi:hypothetical protein CDD80_7011 [Ophiocordyceps camponoti-rufipedis]|uniref:Uncharacterized protein n=1 Tax=Ophiocordyceps camponoti-rufipedis TaxID=2004952 RepID=A0A2C5YNB5_9HYPO|nr:hypothetical protein CDD80_7011 [Ophiocordyceps camponoti-rufipedis]
MSSTAMEAPVSSPLHSRTSSTATTTTTTSSSLTAATTAPATMQSSPPPPPSTSDLLRDLTLVAEAAKRAQVAVLVRDFEDCGLA